VRVDGAVAFVDYRYLGCVGFPCGLQARRSIKMMTSVTIMLVSLKEVEHGHEQAQDEPGGDGHGRPAPRDAQRHVDQREGPGGTRGRAGLRRAPAGTPDRPSAQATTSSRLRNAAETCALQVSHRAAEALEPSPTTTYGDYQTMGIAGSYYQLILDISREAKRLRKTATREQTLAFIAEEAKRRCARTVSTCTTAARYNGFPSC
jgi:hypothetical protein